MRRDAEVEAKRSVRRRVGEPRVAHAERNLCVVELEMVFDGLVVGRNDAAVGARGVRRYVGHVFDVISSMT